MAAIRDILRGFVILLPICAFVGYVFGITASFERGISWLGALLVAPILLGFAWLLGRALRDSSVFRSA